MLSDLVQVIYFYSGVPTLFGIENNVGSFLAGSETHIGFYFDIRESFRLNSLLKFTHELLGASIFAVHVLTNETKRFHKSLLAS